MLNQYEFSSFNAALIRLRYVRRVQQVEGSQQVEDRVLQVDVLARFTIDPGLAHVVGACKAQEWEDRQLQHYQRVVTSGQVLTLLGYRKEAYDTHWKRGYPQVVES